MNRFDSLSGSWTMRIPSTVVVAGDKSRSVIQAYPRLASLRRKSGLVSASIVAALVLFGCWNTNESLIVQQQIMTPNARTPPAPAVRIHSPPETNPNTTATATTTNSRFKRKRKNALPWPNRILATYQRQHSVAALRREAAQSDHSRRRTFAVAYYWCPHRAGNILHGFLNTLVWSILHNRTLLWEYDRSAPDANHVKDCQAILQRQPWLPSYTEFAVKFQLEEPVPVPMEAAQWRYDLQHATVIYPQIADLQFGRTDIYRHSWSDHAMATHQFRRYIDALPAPYKLRAVQLYQEGTDFLFGMLYRACFTLQPSLVRHDIGTRTTTTTTTTTFSVALHSRHTVAADDGSFVKDEMACLRLLLSHHQRKTCRVYLMSDRPATLELIAKELSKMPSNCTVVTTDKNRVNAGTTSSLSREHGPWAGVGFLQDLELAAAARHGAVGDPHRSSFALLVKLMEYDRRMEALQWQYNDKDSLPALETCHLPARSVKGYDYGPGTPTFRHHSFLQPLEPVGLLQTFIKQHSIETTQLAELEQDGRNHRYMVAWLDCDLPVASRLYPVLNSILYAVLQNRTLVWKHNSCPGSNDDDLLRPKYWVPLYDNLTLLRSQENSVPVVHLYESTFDRNATKRNARIVSVQSTRRLSLQDFKSADRPSRKIVEKLYSQGADFLYGMLFHQTFTFKASISDSFLDPSMNSVALHSTDNDSDSDSMTSRSIECLESLFQGTDKPRHVIALSNQNATVLSRLQEWMPRDCSMSTVGAESTSISNYLQAVSEASTARSGFVGHSNATSHVLEWLEYGRRMETWKLGREPFQISDLPKCSLDGQ